MAKTKYGIQKLVQNDLQQCINSFERMKHGGIGIADECVEDTCKRALKYIDALEAKLAESAPVRHGRWNTGYFHDRVCSRCLHPDNDLNDYAHSYCPNCGAKMDGDKND